jgi:preprotein translocase YajC subunit
MNLMTVFFLQAPAAGPDGSMMWIMLIAMFVIMYFFMIRPQNKKQKEIANFRKSLQVNQKVITAGGIILHSNVTKCIIVTPCCIAPQRTISHSVITTTCGRI